MTSVEWGMLVSGLLLLFVIGAWHLGGLLLIRKVMPNPGDRPFLGLLLAFWCLALLHSSEIALTAWAYYYALGFEGTGSISGGYGPGAAGLIYFSGVTYATLAYTQQIAEGPIQLLGMMQALGGFMLITWSATFVYSIWDEQFRHTTKDE